MNATNGSSLFSAFDQPWLVPRGPLGHNSNGRNGFGLDDNVYQALLKNRIIFLGTEVKDENANAICAQMLLLNPRIRTRTSTSTSTRLAVRSIRGWRSTTP